MHYDGWIERERRIRERLLRNSPLMMEHGLGRVCSNCGELCLCHELVCPNCGSDKIVQQVLTEHERKFLATDRIRLRLRFQQLVSSAFQERGTHI